MHRARLGGRCVSLEECVNPHNRCIKHPSENARAEENENRAPDFAAGRSRGRSKVHCARLGGHRVSLEECACECAKSHDRCIKHPSENARAEENEPRAPDFADGRSCVHFKQGSELDLLERFVLQRV